MSRVLVTGGVGTIGGAIVKRLLANPAYEVRISDRRSVPRWMREGCEVHSGDLRLAKEARAAVKGCTHVIYLAGLAEDVAAVRRLPHTLTETSNALHSAVIRAAVEQKVERFMYVSSSMVFERASEFPTSEAYLPDCPTPRSAYGFAMLTGEMYCRAAYEEHGLKYTICRPFDAYGPGMALETRGSDAQTRTPTHADDVAGGVIAAMVSPAGVNEDFNIAAARELTAAEIARIVRETCGEDPAAPEPLPADTIQVERSWPSVEKARRLLGWEAQIEAEEGIAATVEWIQAQGSIGSAT